MNYNDTFKQNGYVYVPGFLDVDTIETISRYFEYSINSNNNGWVSDWKGSGDQKISKFSKYGDPLIEVILRNSTTAFEEIVGEELYPTYSYSRVYVGGDELKKHTDRDSCEYSGTINIATQGNDKWPIFMQAPGGPQVEFTLNPGDAVIYKGCAVEHWRNEMNTTDINVQIMLHYVAKYGIKSNCKWDGRPSLGLPADTSTLRR